MNILKRYSFWRTVTQAFQVGLSSVQGITLATEDRVNNFNVWIAVAQGVLAMISILTQDTNKNNVIDIAESEVTTVTVTGPAEISVEKETKPPTT